MAKVKRFMLDGNLYYFGQKPKHISGVSLNVDSISFENPGETFQLVAEATPAGAIEQTGFTWNSSDTSVATVDSNGLVTCVTPGAATITVTTTIGGFTATCILLEPRIPSIYQEVEYIASTSAGPRINTGVTPNQTTVSQVKVMNLSVTGDTIYGYNIGNDNSDYRLFNYSSAIYWDCYSQRVAGSSFAANTLYEFEVGNNYVKNVGASSNLLTGTTLSSFTGTSTITLNRSNSGTSLNRWYYVKIWNNGTQVRDLVPCYRKQDTVIGMYDIVNKVFYTNAGSGTFVKGGDVV